MLDRTNITFHFEKFLGHVCVYFIGSNDYDCSHGRQQLWLCCWYQSLQSVAIFAVTDNNNTDTTAEAGEARAKLKVLAGKELPTIDGAKTTGDG